MKGRKQMMKKRKWLVSLLAVVLTVTMLPIAAFAQTAERTTGLDLSNKTEAEANEAEGWSWSPDGEGGYTLVLEMSIYPPNRVMPLHFRTM